MAALSSIALVGGLALSGLGVGVQTFGAVRAAEAQKHEIAAQQKAEAAREQSAKLDQQRKQREMIRQGIVARSQALAQGTAQGAQFGSGVAGALAGITEQTNYNVLGSNEQGELGSRIFEANREGFAAKRDQAGAAELGAIGGGLSSLGGTFMKNVGGINRIGGYIAGV